MTHGEGAGIGLQGFGEGHAASTQPVAGTAPSVSCSMRTATLSDGLTAPRRSFDRLLGSYSHWRANSARLTPACSSHAERER